MNLKDELKKGQAFIGLDDNKYYFLGYDYDDQILFTNLDLCSDKEQSFMTKSNIFIKEVYLVYSIQYDGYVKRKFV